MNSDGTQSEEQSHFEEFIVSDNGLGFNEANYESFMQTYSQLKVKKGCKGIDRFLWLKVFDKITVSSVYQENGKWYQREFDFTLNGVAPENNIKELDGLEYKPLIRVTLKGFFPKYWDSVAYSLDSLARKIIEHCLPYFIMGTCPIIELRDNRSGFLNLNNFFDNIYKDVINQDPMELRSRQYKCELPLYLTHI